MLFSGQEQTLLFDLGTEANASGTGNIQQPGQTDKNPGVNSEGGPSIQTNPTPADLIIAQLTNATMINSQLQQENTLMLKKMQEILENISNPKLKKITVSAPKSFDSKPKNYPAFISSLITQFCTDPHTYSTPYSKVWYGTLPHEGWHYQIMGTKDN